MLLITEGLLPFLDPLIQRIVERTSENEIAVLMLLLTNDVVALLFSAIISESLCPSINDSVRVRKLHHGKLQLFSGGKLKQKLLLSFAKCYFKVGPKEKYIKNSLRLFYPYFQNELFSSTK